MVTIFLLPCFAVKLPEIGIPKKEPIGRKKSNPPKAPSLKPKCILISGIRLAQLEKQIPVKKKYPERIMRLVFNEISGATIAQRWGFSRNWVIFAILSYFNSFICIVHIIVEP
jgi:hypothetical protein